MQQQFKEKNSNTWKWVLYVALSAFIVVVGWSINHMTPGLLPIAVAMCAAGLGVSFVYTVYTTHRSGVLRRRAWICESLIVIFLAVQVVIHAGLSRRFDVATQARDARFVEEEREQKRFQLEQERRDRDAKNQAALLERQADLLAQQKQLTDAQSRQLGMIRTANRRQPISPALPQAELPPSVAAPPVTESTPIFDMPKRTIDAVSAMLTPEQVQEQSWWAVLFGILAEVGAIVGTFVYFIRGLIADRNGNGIPDWEEVGDNSPSAVGVHSGRRSVPGMAPTMAQTRDEPKN